MNLIEIIDFLDFSRNLEGDIIIYRLLDYLPADSVDRLIERYNKHYPNLSTKSTRLSTLKRFIVDNDINILYIIEEAWKYEY